MPTSVGPKTYGEENLVFGFDTGDTANSYRGEPTENLVDAFPGTSLPSGFYWTYEYSASISDSPVGNHFLSNKKWVKLTKTSATNGRVLFNQNSFTSGSTYTITAYAFINDSRNTALAFNSDNAGYSQETVDVPYNFTYIGTVQRIRGTWNQLQNGGSIYGLRGGSTNAIGSTIYLTGLQVEENGHPTQLTQGIRSANSGSLKDLTGNNNINLSYVNFNSSAEIDYDGTDDYISCDTQPFSGSRDITFLCWVKSDGALTEARRGIFSGQNTPAGYISFFGYTGGDNGNILFETRDPINSTYQGVSSQGFGIYSGNWNMVGFQIRPGALSVFYANEDDGFYYNESADTRPGFTFRNFNLGVDSSNFDWNGQIDGVRLFNKALTRAELEAHYKAFKSRYI